MKILMVVMFAHLVVCQSSQKSESVESQEIKDSMNLQKLQERLQKKIPLGHSAFKSDLKTKAKTKTSEDTKNSNRKSKSLAYFPFYPPPMLPFGPPPGYFYPQNKEIFDNSYPSEWLSRTEPFKKNPALLDSPTYYIRLPPNPYAFVPGIGYVSRPPSLSDPELLEGPKPDRPPSHVGNDILHHPFYRLPINFLSNGKPTSVYQLPSTQAMTKPESSLVNLSKGPYVFNGKPSEIFLVAQIYDALYGDELTHFYP